MYQHFQNSFVYQFTKEIYIFHLKKIVSQYLNGKKKIMYI